MTRHRRAGLCRSIWITLAAMGALQATSAFAAEGRGAAPATMTAADLDALALAPHPLEPQASAATPGTTEPAIEENQEATGEGPPSSTEQGQTPLSESFGPKTHAAWVRETRRKAFQDTKADVQLRSYYLDRTKYDDSEIGAWALGGSAGFKTGYFREHFSFGSTVYASGKLWGPEEKDGTLLLKPGQHGYVALGEFYGEFLFTEDVKMTVGARAFDTPYINRNDSRMSPNTFTAAVVQGLHGGGDLPEVRWGAGYFDEIKERNADHFVSMAQDAGAPAGVKRGVFATGANYKYKGWSFGLIDYYSNDIINIFYTEGKYDLKLADKRKLTFALQYSDQQSTGDNLLKGRDFKAHQWGGKAELAWNNALFTTAFTSARGDTNMQNPWSGYPGYTSVQVEDFNRDGEDAWMVRAGYNFASVKGLSMYALYVNGSTPDAPGQFSRQESDFNVQWNVPEGPLKGLMVRLRYGQVAQDDPASQDLRDLRVMVYYDPPSL
ncbi:outer membrane porin, OprD family [Lysobacter sp. TY2-98]|uniref:OprD family outer membrane porin n=1 Tax=Lysobacter sp. TY2-98 TaxID=2290922 RepID=UPI000E1FDD6C|nr:OprD family outer membrane porin [Lysobacter sp. TY2-98]AXK71785.1 outer membrane porin, OprD family [Lysobacter sp. TY2-98]